MTAQTTDSQTQTFRDFEQEQRRWLIANSEARIAGAPDRYRDPLRRRAMVRYWQRQIEREAEFLRSEGGRGLTPAHTRPTRIVKLPLDRWIRVW